MMDFGNNRRGDGSDMLQKIRSVLKSPASLVTRPSLASAVLLLMLICHLVLVIWSSVGFEDDFDKFHDHEHTPGMILMWSRAVLSVLFAVLCTRTMGRDGVGDMAQFIRLFRTAGVVWFGIMPLLVVIANLFAEYLRHPVVTGGKFSYYVAFVNVRFLRAYTISMKNRHTVLVDIPRSRCNVRCYVKH